MSGFSVLFKLVFLGKKQQKKTSTRRKKRVSVKKIENVGDENICS
jgi:hypothetical protein